MVYKRLLSILLTLAMLTTMIPFGMVHAQTDDERAQRTVYIHAQGENPLETKNSSTVYMGETADIYFAVDNPNKGAVDGDTHLEPHFDMNGYTVKIYFDPAYFAFASPNTAKPIDYTVPDSKLADSEKEDEEVGDDIVEDTPTTIGYFEYKHGSGSTVIRGKTYKTAYATIFFSGAFLPQMDKDDLWYNLCKLPLTPLRTGNTDVFIDVDGYDPYTLELFAKNVSGEPDEQVFSYSAVNGGSHNIIIKDKLKPASPVADPTSGVYTTAQKVALTAEDGCVIYYSLNGGQTYALYTEPIDVTMNTDITCYAQRNSDGKDSNVVTYSYKIIPPAPFLFDEDKTLLPNIYSEYSAFTVYVSDSSVYGNINDENDIYYTFNDKLSVDSISDGTDPETEWVKIEKALQTIDIDKKCTVRLVTKNVVTGEMSEPALYYLGIKPKIVTADPASGEYDSKIDVALDTETEGATIYYTTDGTDPISNGLEYTIPLTIAKDTTIRAVAMYDGEYSGISSFWYVFTAYDDYGVDAFYPSGVYEGSVNVTLTPNNPQNSVIYRLDGDSEGTWRDYTDVIVLDKDTTIIAKSVAPDGTEGEDEYVFTYKIAPLPPAFAPESTQFTNSDNVTIYSPESTTANTDRFELWYTVDGTDPVTSRTSKMADSASDSVTIKISEYTVISAVVKKDGTTYSSTVTHSYDIVTKKPVKPITTLLPGNYTHEIENEEGFSTEFMPVSEGTEIYYTISYDGSFCPDPVPGTEGTIKYDGKPIEVKGRTVIKAVAKSVIFNTTSDIGIFDYTVTPEPPRAAPGTVISGDKLPVVPVETVKGSTVYYDINGFENTFASDDGIFYIDTSTGNAYADEDCRIPLGDQNNTDLDAPAILEISASMNGISSQPNRYVYDLSSDSAQLAPPYADKQTGTYEEIDIDGDNNLLHVKLYSLNVGANIQYMLNNDAVWHDYVEGDVLKFKENTVLQVRAERNGNYSKVASYVYNFVPLAPIITLPSGRYGADPVPATSLELDSRAPSDKDYSIWYRVNGDKGDTRYTGVEREIEHTMSFKAYVRNDDTGSISENTIHYYIIEADSATGGKVYIASPYDVERISAHVLGDKPYSEGIKLFTREDNVDINYFYTYTKTDGTSATTNNFVYDIAAPIFVNALMDDITVTAWLTDKTGGRIDGSESTYVIDFIHLKTPVTSLEALDKVEFEKDTKYTIIDDYPDDDTICIYYTLDGSDPSDEDNSKRKKYEGEELKLDKATTVKAVYYSTCGKCVECKKTNPDDCWSSVYGSVGTYKYTVPTVKYSGGGGGGGGTKTVDKTRKYTKDVFGNEHPTHIGYIKGYPDGSVKPAGNITREEMAVILYRIANHAYESPFITTGEVFPDVPNSRWSVLEIEYMADKGIVQGYPDGEYKPADNLTRAEFATLITRFVKLPSAKGDNPYPDVEEDFWAYDNIVSLYESGYMQGYEDGSFRPQNKITRAEVMTVVNKILGRKPHDEYVKSLEYNPYNDLDIEKWYYVIVLEATITHNYYLNDKETLEIKWEDIK